MGNNNNIGNREITKAIRDVMLGIYPSNQVCPYAPSTSTTDESYPKATYFVMLVGQNSQKKDHNSYIQVDKGMQQETPNYIKYLVQIDFWARKLSDIDYLVEAWLMNVDVDRHVLLLTSKDNSFSTKQYLVAKDIGKNLDELERNGEKLHRRGFSYTIDVPFINPVVTEYDTVKQITVK